MVRNHDNYSSILEKNSPDSSWLMFYFLRVDSFPDLIDVSGRMAQMTQFISLFLCMFISDDMIAMETICLWTIDVSYYGGCVPLVVTMCH
jgi:hypothetical protein